MSVFRSSTILREPTFAASELHADLLRQADNESIGFVLFFCAADYDLPELANSLNQQFVAIPVVGCTSAGEINELGYADHSVVALAFAKSHFQVASLIVTDLTQFDLIKAQQVVEQLKRQAGAIESQTFVMTLLDGLAAQEELVLLALESALGAIPHFGGSAGDNHQLSRTHLYYQGQFYTQAAVMLMFQTTLPFAVFSTQHLIAGTAKLVVTSASPQSRVVHELNAEPAALAYADLLGLKVEELNATVFALNPLAVRIGQEYYTRSIQKVNADMSLTFYCAMANGMVLTAMQPGDMLTDLADKLNHLSQVLGQPLLTIGCDCVLRKIEVAQHQLAAPAAGLFQQFKVLGFNTYGEHFNGVHLNQTFTGVMFGDGNTLKNTTAKYVVNLDQQHLIEPPFGDS